MLTTQSASLYILHDIRRGRSIHTADMIAKGSIIEICPAIILPKVDTPKIHQTLLHDYYFLWKSNPNIAAIALGYGSLYNHSETPNADFELVYGDEEIHFFALEDIQAGSEIFIDYMAGKIGSSELWFDVK